jgi:hypothetical protein
MIMFINCYISMLITDFIVTIIFFQNKHGKDVKATKISTFTINITFYCKKNRNIVEQC